MNQPQTDVFTNRHIGPDEKEIQHMLQRLGQSSLKPFMEQVIPSSLRAKKTPALDTALTEAECQQHLRQLAQQNQVYRSFIGRGFHNTYTPAVIRRCMLENPQWYTPYTPYQAEISQGRLELLMHFQTAMAELTGLDLANASLLDESTAAVEAMTCCQRLLKRSDKRSTFWVDAQAHPRTIALLKTRAAPLGITIQVQEISAFEFDDTIFGALVQYPSTNGVVPALNEWMETARAKDIKTVFVADPLALCLLKSPGEWGADIAVGNAQRLGLPFGFGGPHAAYFATRKTYQRQVPGRIIGLSKDSQGNPAYRMALQTREQHIRRDKATSNICTAQALPAMINAAYILYHGKTGLQQKARMAHLQAKKLATLIDHKTNTPFFDTLRVNLAPKACERAEQLQLNLSYISDQEAIVALDETVTEQDLHDLTYVITGSAPDLDTIKNLVPDSDLTLPERKTDFLNRDVFKRYHSETNLMRYLDQLQQKDIGLTDGMIPLGSCTMKLNPATAMESITLPGFANIHPLAPKTQTQGYAALLNELKKNLETLTGFDAVSLEPNAGSQGELAGLLAIRNYHLARNDHDRNLCIIPDSAHGTNPASARLAGMQIVHIPCDTQGNVDVEALRQVCEKNPNTVAAFMITYPSTHGVFERTIREICSIIHKAGGKVYMDGANLNALLGYCTPADLGADVCHLNLHKTFCIPHGGGGPGMGPIGVTADLAPFLPNETEPISQSPYGSGSILAISYAYICMIGGRGLKQASTIAVLNANYIAHRLDSHFPVLYRGPSGFVAHECILDCRPFQSLGIGVEDIAKRLIDYGFHAPTMSWPVPGTLMIEPTESESLSEIDRFCEALISIRDEIRQIEEGNWSKENNPLIHAPHTAEMCTSEEWKYPYSRTCAAYPAHQQHKFWPPVGRVDNAYGDRNLVCACS